MQFNWKSVTSAVLCCLIDFLGVKYHRITLKQNYPIKNYRCCTGAHSQLWETTLPVFSPYAPRKCDMRFGTPAIV